ncbi:MAG: hypothetical protein NTV80_23105 [Verrucomicrobia bacterium]|nr:hypothetical protein [Verrucomicrobiota bacterium]
MSAPSSPFQLAVISPSGKDQPQSFPNGAGALRSAGHAPVNFHAYAACTHGTYGSSPAEPDKPSAVLLLIGGKMERALQSLRTLKKAGHTVVITLKETGLSQISSHFQNFAQWTAFQQLCSEADGALATTFDTQPLYQSANQKLPIAFIPPPYPVEETEWDISRQITKEKKGVFVGTRQLFVASRNHAVALTLLSPLTTELNEPVTVISGRASDLPPLKRLLNKTRDYSHAWHQQFSQNHPHVRVIAKQMPTVDYLGVMATHKLVFQLDTSAVPGQVAGDALLCRIPCVGGNGTAERLVYPDLCGHGRSTGEILDLTRRLLTDMSFRQAQMDQALALAKDKMCFSVARAQLQDFYQSLD